MKRVAVFVVYLLTAIVFKFLLDYPEPWTAAFFIVISYIGGYFAVYFILGFIEALVFEKQSKMTLFIELLYIFITMSTSAYCSSCVYNEAIRFFVNDYYLTIIAEVIFGNIIGRWLGYKTKNIYEKKVFRKAMEEELMKIAIRDVCVEDAKELLEIYGPYVQQTAITFEYEVPSVEEFQSRIVNITKKYPYLVAVDEGEIVGYCYAGAFKARAAYDWAVETTIYIRKDFRGRGLGRKLYGKLEEALKAQGILNLCACIACPKGESPYLTSDSIKFHEKLGYKLVGRFHDCGYKFDNWFDMVWMEKMVGEHTDSQAPIKPYGEINR